MTGQWEMKSAIYLQQEKLFTNPVDVDTLIDGLNYYSAPFTLSYDDNISPGNELEDRIRISLEKNNRIYHYTDWPNKIVVYKKMP